MKSQIKASVIITFDIEEKYNMSPEDVAADLLDELEEYCCGEIHISEVKFLNASNSIQEGQGSASEVSTGRDIPGSSEMWLKIDYLNGYKDRS